MSRRRSIVAGALVAVVCAPAATARVAPPKPDARIAAEVPAAVRASGTLRIATSATYPPNEFVMPNGRTVVGMDADLARALAGVMGLRPRIVNTRFDTIVHGV